MHTRKHKCLMCLTCSLFFHLSLIALVLEYVDDFVLCKYTRVC